MSARPASANDTALRTRARRAWLAYGLGAAILLAITLFVAGFYGRNAALVALEEQGRAEANLKVALLRAVLERPRALPFFLSRDRDVEDALRSPDADGRLALSRRLQELVAGTSASVLYVIDGDGVTVSASNWQEPTSFVGSNYAFRDYYSVAMRDGTAEYFALGNVSRRPGLYISQRVGPVSAPLGVVVVKMEFDQLEQDWRETNRPSYVVDEHDVVLITNRPSWRFMTTRPLPQDSLAAIRESLQFGEAPLLPLPITDIGETRSGASLQRVLLPGGGNEDHLRITVPVVSTPWRFEYLLPVAGPVSTGERQTRLAAVLALSAILLAGAIWLYRRQSVLAAIARDQAAREELERRVTERTQDLSLARDRLQAEITGHRSTEAKLQAVQQDLVQANRLAILGQVAAGVAHEINQPVATIRAYADNAKVFLSRGKTGTAAENLDFIAGLTERIGAITDNLKALARKGRTGAEPVDLHEVTEGALMLLRSRFTGHTERVRIALPPDLPPVTGNRLRLEQVFINLLQNALEAVGERPDGQVMVSARAAGDEVIAEVSDNGPGIAPAILEALFEPFNTSKEAGLGLGLAIVKDIVTDYGGRIEAESGDAGACFRIHLRKASA